MSGDFPTVGQVQPQFGGWERLSIDIGDGGLMLEYAAKLAIMSRLEAECKRQETFWSQRVIDIQAQLGPNSDVPAPQIKRVAPKNFYTGSRPGLINAPIDFWPSVTVRAGDLRPDASQPDEYDTFVCDLYVEVMTYGGPVRGRENLHLADGIQAEGEANMQTHLLSSAVMMCIRDDPTLGGMIMPIQRPPTIRPSFPTAVNGSNVEHGDDIYYIYQGRQLTYSVTRNSY